jgi:lysophospholipase L1-like esterase
VGQAPTTPRHAQIAAAASARPDRGPGSEATPLATPTGSSRARVSRVRNRVVYPEERGPIRRILSTLLLALLASGLTVRGYLANGRFAFLAGLFGLAVALGPLPFALRRRRAPGRALRLCLACSASAFFLLLVELVWSAAAALRPPPPLPPRLTYEEAIADPAGFLRWWNENVGPNVALLREITMPDPSGKNPYVLKPGPHQSYRSTIHINRLGFRGPEFPRAKGDQFRIVTIGESTTFDVTLFPEDRTWSQVLEARIAEQLACDRPVQVINAGVPGWTLANQVKRLPDDILPLSPDLIVAYHGFNGFHFFFNQLPEVTIRSSGSPPPRPSRVLERLESAVRLAWFRRRYRAVPELDAAVHDLDLWKTPYAEFYRQLAEQARGVGAQVAFCTFNMAVNTESPEQALRLHEGLVPDLRARILANRLHTRLVRELAERLHVVGIDTSPGLDGAYRDAYIDVAHFTQVGRDRMAANVLDGLRETLRDHPRLHCRPRAGEPEASAGHAD